MNGRSAGGQDDTPRLLEGLFRTEAARPERRIETVRVDAHRGVVRPGDLNEHPLVAGLPEINEHIVVSVNPA